MLVLATKRQIRSFVVGPSRVIKKMGHNDHNGVCVRILVRQSSKVAETPNIVSLLDISMDPKSIHISMDTCNASSLPIRPRISQRIVMFEYDDLPFAKLAPLSHIECDASRYKTREFVGVCNARTSKSAILDSRFITDPMDYIGTLRVW